jgi:hypothetical protein
MRCTGPEFIREHLGTAPWAFRDAAALVLGDWLWPVVPLGFRSALSDGPVSTCHAFFMGQTVLAG